MGQKVHPLGFRLGVTQNYYSNWYASSLTYSNYVLEDYKLRQYLQNFLKTAGLAKIEINRQIDQLEVCLFVSRSGLLVTESGDNGFENLRVKLETYLKKNFESYLGKKDFLRLVINEVETPELEASLTALGIAEDLEKRVAFRKAMRSAIVKAKKAKIEGIKIQVSGRLNGAEMARTEWVREGRVPLQTLRAKIDYSHREANTIYGVIGIKVWIFKGESL